MKKPKKTIAVKTLESQLAYVNESIDIIHAQIQTHHAQVDTLRAMRENIERNIEALMQEKPDDLPF
jgi:cell division protein FtsB